MEKISEKRLYTTLSLILRQEEISRININESGEIVVDLHNMKTKEAMIFINNIINVNRDEVNVRLIHGYNHGIALKDMINNRFRNSRIVEKKSVQNNLGVTVLNCRSLCSM